MSRKSAQEFLGIVEEMKRRYDIRIWRWRTSMSGKAWRVYYHDGRAVNWIESPRPKTPISLAIFLHEVGHHVIGFQKYRPRSGLTTMCAGQDLNLHALAGATTSR